MRHLALLLASFGYAGYAPVAPGTAGSAAALAVYVALRWLEVQWLEIPVIVGLFGAGVWAATRVAHQLGEPDPGLVVVDEVVGMLITLALVPVGVAGALAGFVLFRLFDVIKPFPAAQSERLPGGYGIMVDDVFAGLYAHLVLRALAWAWPAGILVS